MIFASLVLRYQERHAIRPGTKGPVVTFCQAPIKVVESDIVLFFLSNMAVKFVTLAL